MGGDGRSSISPASLYTRIGTAAAPVVMDVRRAETLGSYDRVIVAALHRDPGQVGAWSVELNREARA